jgi:hypothetical protein
MSFANVPTMPIHHEPKTAYAVYTVLMTVITVGLLVYYATSKSERKHGPLLPLLLAGGAISALYEPVFDNLILYWYPPHNSFQAFAMWDRSIPWFVPIGYAWFCGALPYLAYRVYRRGVTARQVWLLLAAVMVIDAAAISTAGWLGTSGFFGNQPFNLWGKYPLWWAGIDGPHVIVGGAILYLLIPRLQGRSLAVLLLVPTVTLGLIAGVCAWPVALALHSGWSDVPTHIAGAATFALGMGLVWLATQVVAGGRAVPAAAIAEDGTRLVTPQPPAPRVFTGVGG